MVWKYSLNHGGYGVLTIDGRNELTHRVSFIQSKGPIPTDKQVNHLCDRPYCIQPSHLYAGTAQDNRDDSKIFANEDLHHAPVIMLEGFRRETEDPFLRRLMESVRYEYTEPWEPVQQPAQKPLQEFTCPSHDFAIPTQSDLSQTARICRICEVSQLILQIFNDPGTYQLIASLCPASQTVAPILEKIGRSKFVDDSYRDIRSKTYSRQYSSTVFGDHNLRNCSCDYCTQDRKHFRAAVEPILTPEESAILDICDRMEPSIAKALTEASTTMNFKWAQEIGLREQHLQTFYNHLNDCPNTHSETTQAAAVAEQDLAYALYAVSAFETEEDMREDEQFQHVIHRLLTFRYRDTDQADLSRIIAPIAEDIAQALMSNLQKEAEQFLKPYEESKPDLLGTVFYMAHMMVKKQAVEVSRYAFFGRNTSSESTPHPHASCAETIQRTGTLKSFHHHFTEGKGYNPPEN